MHTTTLQFMYGHNIYSPSLKFSGGLRIDHLHHFSRSQRRLEHYLLFRTNSTPNMHGFHNYL